MLPPSFQQQLKQAETLPPFPKDYQPQIVEFFDQFGLLLSQINGEYVESHDRPANYENWYLGLFFDGELAYCSVGSQIVLNRLQNIVAWQKQLGNLVNH